MAAIANPIHYEEKASEAKALAPKASAPEAPHIDSLANQIRVKRRKQLKRSRALTKDDLEAIAETNYLDNVIVVRL